MGRKFSYKVCPVSSNFRYYKHRNKAKKIKGCYIADYSLLTAPTTL